MPAIAGSQGSVAGGAWILTGCPPGYALQAQACAPCPATWYCPGRAAPAVHCGEGNFSLPRAASPADCAPAVYAIVRLRLAQAVSERSLGALEGALAAALGVPRERVFVADVSQPGTAMPKVVTANIASDNAAAAGEITQSVVPEALMGNLARHGFADAAFLSVTVTACVPGFDLVLSVCEPCPIGYYCLGGTTLAKGCPAGYFSAPRANASAACWAADFVMISASLQLPDAWPAVNASLDKIFRAALAAAAQVPLDSVVVNSIGQRGDSARRATQASFDAGIAAAQGTGPDVAERIRSDLNLELQRRGLPPASLNQLTVTGGAGAAGGVFSSVRLIVGLVVGFGAAVAACMVAPYLLSRAQAESEEDRLLRAAVQALRERLGITLREGYMLSTETGAVLSARRWCWAPRARRLAEMTVVRRSYLESAARLALLEVARPPWLAAPDPSAPPRLAEPPWAACRSQAGRGGGVRVPANPSSPPDVLHPDPIVPLIFPDPAAHQSALAWVGICVRARLYHVRLSPCEAWPALDPPN